MPSFHGGKQLSIGCPGQVWQPLRPSSKDVCSSSIQYDLVHPNSSTHVATLYLGPMGSLGAYIEGMDGLSLLFTGVNMSVWQPEPGLALRPSSKDVCSSSMIWCTPILLRMLQHCIWDPWGAFGHVLKEWMAFPSPSQRPTAPIWLSPCYRARYN